MITRGSNSFFGDDGRPMAIDTSAQILQMNGLGVPVKEASDLRASISYRF